MTRKGTYCSACGYNVAGWSRRPKSIEGVIGYHGGAQLHDFLARSDILVCLLPLTPETRGVLNSETFRALPRGGTVINCARGEHLVEADLLAALDDGTLSGASLDVFETEPLHPDHPFWGHPRIVVTPHVSSLSNPRSAIPQIVDNIRRARDGRPLLNRVDPQAQY